jgi:CRP/FNR family transcriptional regulator, cyclic AMP receptor protein
MTNSETERSAARRETRLPTPERGTHGATALAVAPAPARFAGGLTDCRPTKRRPPPTTLRRQDIAVTAETLAVVKVFRNVPRDILQIVSTRCRWRWFNAHQAIVQLHDNSRDVFFVVRGKACAMHYSVNGREVRLHDLPAGEMFGELSAIDGQSRSANVVAVTDTLVAIMPAPLFWEAIHKHEPFAAAVLRALAGLVRRMSDRVIELSTLSVRSRIHVELLRLSRASPADRNSAIISPIPTHAELASRVSTHREAVTRELNELARAGLIERRTGKLVIRDVAALVEMVNEVVGNVSLQGLESD